MARMSRGNPAQRAIDYGHSCESLPQVQERQIPLETSLQPSLRILDSGVNARKQTAAQVKFSGRTARYRQEQRTAA